MYLPILALYSYGYPSNRSSNGTLAFQIAYDLLWIMIGLSSYGGPVPGQQPRDMSLDLFWGVVFMFAIVYALGETINWLVEEIRRLRRPQEPHDKSTSPKSSGENLEW
jgi:hypothetical protein